MKKKIIFRADGNTSTGLGHLYRLFSLVEIYKDYYEYVYITQKSSNYEVIPDSYPTRIISEEMDLLQEPIWLASIYNPEKYVIIADGYHFVSEYQKKIKELGFSLIYIDDLAKEHMYADIVVNHTSSFRVSDFSSAPYTKFALGTDYALLRPSFLKAAKEKGSLTAIDTAFVCFGGADKFDFSLQTTKVLLEINQIKSIHIVLGAAYNTYQIDKLAKKFPNRVKISKNLSEKDLINIMRLCNLAVAPTSTILYELSCVKMPIISGYFVENQKLVYNWFKQQGCFYGVEDFCKFNFDRLKYIIEEFNDSTILQKYMDNQFRCIDGNQKHRFLELMNDLLQ